MTSAVPSRSATTMAWLAVLLIGGLIVLGLVWYGFSLDVHNRIWRDTFERSGGPMTFRFYLQPTMAFIAALHDGINDARLNRAPYFWTVLHDSAQREGRLREGLFSTARIILLGLGMDAIYQYRVFSTFYPGEAVLITLLLAVFPYFLLRGPIERIAQRWFARDSRGSPQSRS